VTTTKHAAPRVAATDNVDLIDGDAAGVRTCELNLGERA
jgi:hypothetical protein